MYSYEKILRSFMLYSFFTNTDIVSGRTLYRTFCGAALPPDVFPSVDVVDGMLAIESDETICLVHDTSGILMDDVGYEEDVYAWYDKENSAAVSRTGKTPVCCLLHTDRGSSVYRSIRRCPSGRRVHLFNLSALQDPGLQADKILYDYGWLLKEIRESIRLSGLTLNAVREAIQDLPADGTYTEFLQAHAETYGPFLCRRLQMETAGQDGRRQGFQDGFLQTVLTAAPPLDDKELTAWLARACGISKKTAEQAAAGFREKKQRA